RRAQDSTVTKGEPFSDIQICRAVEIDARIAAAVELAHVIKAAGKVDRAVGLHLDRVVVSRRQGYRSSFCPENTVPGLPCPSSRQGTRVRPGGHNRGAREWKEG